MSVPFFPDGRIDFDALADLIERPPYAVPTECENALTIDRAADLPVIL